MDRAGLDPAGLTRELGFPQGTVWGWLKEGTVPNGKALLRLPAALRVNGHWLLTGEGAVEPPDVRERAASLTPAQVTVILGEIGERMQRLVGEARLQVLAVTSPDEDAERAALEVIALRDAELEEAKTAPRRRKATGRVRRRAGGG